MCVGDWSSDVCSSDLLTPTKRGEGLSCHLPFCIFSKCSAWSETNILNLATDFRDSA